MKNRLVNAEIAARDFARTYNLYPPQVPVRAALRLVGAVVLPKEILRDTRCLRLMCGCNVSAVTISVRHLLFLQPEKRDFYLQKLEKLCERFGYSRAHFIVLVNPFDSYRRQRFSLAHELEHIVQGHFSLPGKVISILQSTQIGSSNVLEREADRFAAEFLVPRSVLKRLYFEEGIRNMLDLEEYFDVSRQVLEIQLRKIGVR